jgi:hypothetical protein
LAGNLGPIAEAFSSVVKSRVDPMTEVITEKHPLEAFGQIENDQCELTGMIDVLLGID